MSPLHLLFDPCHIPERTNKFRVNFSILLYSTHFCKYVYSLIKVIALERLYYTKIKSVGFPFFVCFCEPLQELFSPQTAILLRHGFQPNLDQLPPWKWSEVAKTLLFGSNIHNMANSGSYLGLIRKAEGSEFSENSPAKLDTSARAGSPMSEN